MKYKITISAITEREIKKTAEEIVHKKTGEVIDWMTWYDLPEDEKKHYEKHRIATGEIDIDENTKVVYEQDVDDLDIGDLAIYINRAK